jgi:hypothetical protein
MTIVHQAEAVQFIALIYIPEVAREDGGLCLILIAGEEEVTEEGDEVLSFTTSLHELHVFLPTYL